MMTERSNRSALARALALAFCLSGVGCGATQRIALPTSEARARDATAWHIVSSPPPPPPVEKPRPEPEQTADATSPEAVAPDETNAETAAAATGAAAPNEAITPHEAADASPSPGPGPAEPQAQPAAAARAPTVAATSWDEPTDDDDTTTTNRVTRSKRFHDGAYSRYGIGGGYQSVTSGHGSTVAGGGVSVDAWFGGTPAPGWAIGGMWSALLVPDPQASISAADNNGVAVSGQARGVAVFSSVGPFVDFYPDPSLGLHFMAGFTYSSFSFTNDAGESSESVTGAGLFGGAGYEAWIGNEWSLGLLARLQWAALMESSGTTTALAPVVLLGLTCH